MVTEKVGPPRRSCFRAVPKNAALDWHKGGGASKKEQGRRDGATHRGIALVNSNGGFQVHVAEGIVRVRPVVFACELHLHGDAVKCSCVEVLDLRRRALLSDTRKREHES
jgi:hypothetical protein